MNQELCEYIQSIIPKDYPDGRQLLEEGKKIGKTIEVPRTKFLEKHNAKTYLDFRKQRLSEGKITWQLLLGLATLEDQLNAIKEIDKFNQRNAYLGMEISGVQSIPSQIVGLPHEYWDEFPQQTSYEMCDPEDWIAHNEVVPIQVAWQDFHLANPASLQTTINALEAGTDRLGCFSGLIWDYAGYDDDKQRFSDMVRSLGILSTKKSLHIDVVTYPEDGLPGFFIDITSWLGYTMVEHYISTELCDCLFSVSFGGLLTTAQERMAFALACHKLFSSDDHPGLVYFNGGTVDQISHDINANFGTSIPEMFLEILFVLNYKVPVIISPVAVTEALRTPSLEELLDIAAAGIRSETKAKDWLPLIDWTLIERIADDMIDKAQRFFDNMMNCFIDAGVDVKDPLEMIMMLRRFNPVKFEQSFHPSINEKNTFEPYYPSQLGQDTMIKKNLATKELQEKGYDLSGKKIVCVSTDIHSYGLLLIDNVFTDLNANVVNGGVSVEAIDALDLADEEGTNIICISTHSGQALSYSKLIVELAKSRNQEYKILMGGQLTSLLPGETLPVNVQEMICELGVYANNNLAEQIEFILNN